MVPPWQHARQAAVHGDVKGAQRGSEMPEMPTNVGAYHRLKDTTVEKGEVEPPREPPETSERGRTAIETRPLRMSRNSPGSWLVARHPLSGHVASRYPSQGHPRHPTEVLDLPPFDSGIFKALICTNICQHFGHFRGPLGPLYVTVDSRPARMLPR